MKNKKQTKKKKDKFIIDENNLDFEKGQKERNKIFFAKQDKENLLKENLMHEDYENEINADQPIRDLFSAKNVRFKTEVTPEQRSSIAVLYHAYRQATARGYDFSGLKMVLDEFIDFGVSLERKSRTEFVDTHKALNTLKKQDDSQRGENVADLKY